MYLVEQQERLAASATNPVTWGRHGYCEDVDSLRLRSTAKGLTHKLSAPGHHHHHHNACSLGTESSTTGLASLLPTISPSLNLSIRSVIMLLGTPTLTTLFLYSCDRYQCAVAPGIRDLLDSMTGLESIGDVLQWAISLPVMWFSWRGLAIYLVWYMVQAVMYAVVPGRIGYGQKTLAGRQLPYQLNGLTCYIITHVAFISAVYYKLIPISIIANNWLGLFVAANMMGYFLTVFAYVKARLFPCHPDDCKFSGSFLYDMFMGVEFNPRLGKLWDFKLFHNGRPGIIAWTLIDISFIFSDLNGNFIIPSTPALLVLLLHTMYVIDFFWHEDWYLRTIDIAHDHFGFYLAWGDTVWLPYMYTMQAQYLYRNQLNLRGDTFGLLELGVLALGLGGYAIFRGSNNQKDTVRHAFNRAAEQDKDVDKELQKHVRIWGRPPTYILAPYRTSDGKSHTSILLTCGYWGLARHMNYLGDMLMATGMGLATQKVVGGGGIVGWWYTVYLIALLVHRVWRCDERCGGKYGAKWKVYREVVRWRILPGVF